MQQLKMEFVVRSVECRPAPLLGNSGSAKVPGPPGQAMKLFNGCAALPLTPAEEFSENVNIRSTSAIFAKSRHRFAPTTNLPIAGATTDSLKLR